MKDFLDNNSFKFSRGSLQSLLVIATIYGVQELFRSQFFKCPCSHFTLYSLAMMSAPSAFLLGVGFLTSDGYWRVVLTRRDLRNYKLRCNYCLKSMPRLFQPFLPSVAFMVFVLLRGDYYACARVGAPGEICQKQDYGRRYTATSRTTSLDITKYYTQSQLLGCGLLAGVTMFTVGIVFIRNCCFDGDTIPDDEGFRQLEQNILASVFREKLKDAIEEDVKRTVEEAFNGQEDRAAMTVYRQAKDHVNHSQGQKTLGRFTRLTQAEDEQSVIRIVDSTL